jgi:carbohydrate kinase (thermoresistant glucokinase family)
MGGAGAGKSTVGPRLAERLGVPFVDGDDEHSERARARMAAGVPLDDDDRSPWLDRVHQVLVDHEGSGVVVACSALKRSYRHRLAAGLPDAPFVALVAPPAVLEARLEAREGHFVGADLLASQLASLELDPEVVRVDGTAPVDDVVEAALRAVRDRA